MMKQAKSIQPSSTRKCKIPMPCYKCFWGCLQRETHASERVGCSSCTRRHAPRQPPWYGPDLDQRTSAQDIATAACSSTNTGQENQACLACCQLHTKLCCKHYTRRLRHWVQFLLCDRNQIHQPALQITMIDAMMTQTHSDAWSILFCKQKWASIFLSCSVQDKWQLLSSHPQNT